jgi:hypothetical protein
MNIQLPNHQVCVMHRWRICLWDITSSHRDFQDFKFSISINCVSGYVCVVLANRCCIFLCCSFQSCWYPFFILCPTLPVSLDCTFLIATSVFSYIYLYRTDIQRTYVFNIIWSFTRMFVSSSPVELL